jgi:hypothetical protein
MRVAWGGGRERPGNVVASSSDSADFSAPSALIRILPPADKPQTGPKADPLFEGNKLLDLQVELVRAAVRLTRYFGKQFSEESPAITQLSECSVTFDPGNDDANDALFKLFEATDIAQEMQGSDSNCHESPFLTHTSKVKRRFEKQRVYHKLLVLIMTLLGEESYIFEPRLKRHYIVGSLPIPREHIGRESDDCGRLRLDAVQWMSELLWYTMRYWIPYYPTTAELAFELSLAVRHAPARRAELAQAAQALENEKEGQSVRIVGELVRYCEGVEEEKGFARETEAFYRSIAAVLQYQFEMYRENATKARGREVAYKDRFNKSRTTTPSAKTIPVPIAFTTNFDTAIEQIFRKHKLPHHLIFPVTRLGDVENGEEPNLLPVWVIKTWYSEGEETEEDWLDICDDDKNPKISFEGPVIVKLHGSPSIQSSDRTLQHWLVLSEVGYLRALARESPPAWLEGQLCSGASLKSERERSLWFLGYSISDWNVRLRLYEHCKGSISMTPNKSGGVRRSTVDRMSDIYRAAILDGLEVNQWIGDLNDLPHKLLTALMDDEIIKSDAVCALMTGVATSSGEMP